LAQLAISGFIENDMRLDRKEQRRIYPVFYHLPEKSELILRDFHFK